MVITLTKGSCARSRNFEARQLRIWADVDVFLVPGQRQTPQEWEGKTSSDHFWIKEVPQLRIVNLEEYHPFHDKVMMVRSEVIRMPIQLTVLLLARVWIQRIC